MGRLREIVTAATPGPWEVYDPNEGSDYGPLWSVANDAFHNPPEDEDEPWVAVEVVVGGREDAVFIATFDPVMVSALLDVAEAAEAMWDAFGRQRGHGSICAEYDAYDNLNAALSRLDGATREDG